MAKKKNETALAKNKEDNVPKWLEPVEEGELIEGLENMRPGDLLVPRLVLLQALSPQVSEGDNKAGEIINSITGEIWVDKDEEMDFIPVFHYLEWIEWGDREQNEGMKSRSLDPEGKLAQMSMRAQKYQDSKGVDQFMVTEYHNFICIVPDIDTVQPVVISCAKTNHKKGRKLLGLAKFRGRYPLFAGKYSIKALQETNRANQKYFVFEFKNAGWASKDIFESLKELYEKLKTAFSERKLYADQQDEQNAEALNETEM